MNTGRLELSTTEVVGVVLVNYFSESHVHRCLDSLRENADALIIIVDNSSDSEEFARLQHLVAGRTRIQLLRNEENFGFGVAANMGSELALSLGCQFIWILNPDTIVDSRAIQYLRAVIEDDIADIVSPLISTGEDKVWFAGGHLDAARGVTWHWRLGEDAACLPGGSWRTDFMTGAAPFMRGTTWRTLGGFSADYFLYWEDAELSVRAKNLGLRLQVAGDARIWHAQGGSTGTADGGNSPTYYFYGQRNRILVCGGFVSKWRLLIGSGSRETVRLLIEPVLRERTGRPAKFRASISGIGAGLRGLRGRGHYPDRRRRV